MPLFKGKAGKAKPKKAIDYVTRPDKAVIVSSLSMDDSRDYARQFKETCDLYGKGSGFKERKYYHFKLSPNPADNPAPEQSHELAEKLAEQLFAAHECVIATHIDTGTIHSHIIVNAVSFETGKKLHLSKGERGEYAGCKDLAETLGASMGLTPLDWRAKVAEKYERMDRGEANETKALSSAERNIAKRGNLTIESWKEALRQAIDETKAHCTDRNQFQQYLQDNFGVTMPRNTARTVSFVHPAVGETYTVRGAKLGADYTATNIDQALRENRERSVTNAGLFAAEERPGGTGATAIYPETGHNPVSAKPTASARPTSAETTDTIPNVPTVGGQPTGTIPYSPTIGSQPTSQTGNRKRPAPRSLSDVGAELRSIDEAVQSIVGKDQSDGGDVGGVAKKGDREITETTASTGEHEQYVHQKPKRRPRSYER